MDDVVLDDENHYEGTCRACGVCRFDTRPWCNKVPVLISTGERAGTRRLWRIRISPPGLYWVNIECKDIFMLNTNGRELTIDEVEVLRVMNL
jgi:hypothetical protein